MRRFKYAIVVSAQPARFEAATFKGDLAANLERVASLGYDGAELAIRDPRQVDVAWLAGALQRLGLEVPAIGTGQAWGEEGLSFTDPDPEVREAAIRRVKDHIPVARDFGAVVIIGLLRGTLQPGVSRDQAMEWLIAALQECADAALAANVRLALEPINRYETALVNTVDEGLALIRRVGAANLGLLLDTFHMNIEEPSIEESIRKAGPHIFHFHVADSNRWHPGAGHLDSPRILRVLAETGYRGYVSGEFLPKPDAQTAAREAIRYLRAIAGAE